VGGERWIREDVHIHASAEEVYELLASLHSHGRWLPRTFRGVEANGDELSFELSLPLRREQARLSVTAGEAPTLLVLASGRDAEQGAGNGVGPFASLTWALHSEAAGEVHVTLEAEYRPAGGVVGALLEPLLYYPLRRQAFRDALWRLKLFVERHDGSSA
jgi:hypothetical protein